MPYEEYFQPLPNQDDADPNRLIEKLINDLRARSYRSIGRCLPVISHYTTKFLESEVLYPLERAGWVVVNRHEGGKGYWDFRLTIT
jgi:hypothetical protein